MAKQIGKSRGVIPETIRLAKNLKIKEKGMETRARHSKMKCQVITVKIQENKLSNTKKEKLARVFLESKWIRNASLASQDFSVNFLKTLDGSAPVKTPTGMESRPITIGSQLQQSTLTQLRSDHKALSARKNKGYKIGNLKFVSEVNSVNLQQYGNSYSLNFQNGTARLQNIGVVKVRGLDQVTKLDNYELANAKLLNKPDGYYLAITVYSERETPKVLAGTLVGLDMGLKTHITLSDGTEINVLIEETERLKRLQRKLARQVKGSNSWNKTRVLVRREYQKISDRKSDRANKVVHNLLLNELVFMQDESLVEWKRRSGFVRGGRVVQHSILGRVKAALVKSDRVVILPKSVATSQICVCGVKTKHNLSERVFTCGQCGYVAGRDVHAAQNMVVLGKDFVPVGRRDFKPVERVSDCEANLLVFQLRAAKPETSWSSALT